MKNKFRFLISFLLIFAFFANIFPCGPVYIAPLFDYKSAPEDPFQNFAAGRIGILKPTYHRSVLFAAYRYLNNGSFNAAEQKALVEVWNAEFNNKDFGENDVQEAVKQWVEQRKDVAGKEEPTPEIYVEREYGGYDFFPNCTKNAFETATQTLKDRIASHGSDNRDVKNWLAAQDKVFTNCASGKQTPDPPNAEMPEWLQKDRTYQMAAAAFYSLDYAEAKRRFAEIAQDTQSPWQKTADYLVGRTLLRQASLMKDKEKARQIYTEAGDHLYRLSVSGNKYADSAERLLGLVKYRLHPEQRIRELAQTLSFQGGENFRQDLIDYTWLMDKFQKEALEREEQRKKEANSDLGNTNEAVNPDEDVIEANESNSSSPKNEGDLAIYLYSDDYQKNWTIYVKPEATDAEAIAEAEKVTGMPLTDRMKEQVRDGRKIAYSNRFSNDRESGYQGSYYGEEETRLSILPEFLRADDLTDWLFTYQINNAEAYLYSLNRFKQNGSDLWLATAISKADKSSPELNRLFEAADKTPPFSPAFPTIFYHRLRLLTELNKKEQARVLLDEFLASPVDVPVSTRNQFIKLRFDLSTTLKEYLIYGLRKPFGFGWSGEAKTIEEIIEDRKSWYDPKYETVSKEEYDRQIEEEFAEARRLQNELMFDDETILLFNEHFPLEVLREASKEEYLPGYLRERFLKTAFVRSLLLADYKTAEKLAPDFVKIEPELQEAVNQFLTAKPAEKQFAALYLILKNEKLTPYLSSGLGTPIEQYAYASRWWCKPYDEYYDADTDRSIPRSAIPKPAFLTQAQSSRAKTELKKLKEIGDAPKYLGEKVLQWARLRPKDKRIPESLFIVYEANDWDKHGCGGHRELRSQAANILKTRYPYSDWSQKVADEEQ